MPPAGRHRDPDVSGRRLEAKAVVVTGAGRGIGQAIAVRCGDEGASVVCVDIDEANVNRTAEAIARAHGTASAVVCDVSTESGNDEMVAHAVDRYGTVDALVANAAVQFLGTVEETPETEWVRMESTNLRGVFLGARRVIPVMRDNGGGSLIFVASVLGIVGDSDLPAYGAMKGGVRSMCRALATAHGPQNIRCNTICPGDVATLMNEEFFDHQPDPEAAKRAITDRYPLRRFATPRDVANVALFLASDEAAYLNGIDIVVDGGLLARIY